jgi:hypothetical protein
VYEYILRYHLASLKTQGHGLRARPLGQAGRGGSRPRGGWVGGDPAGARGMTSGRSTATPLFSAAQRSVSIEIGFDNGQLSPFALPDQVVCIRSPIVFGSWRVVPSTLLDPQDVSPEQGHICITSTGDPFQQHGNLSIPEHKSCPDLAKRPDLAKNHFQTLPCESLIASYPRRPASNQWPCLRPAAPRAGA